MSRDDFSAETRTILAKRAGYRCSRPACRIMTVGPSRESHDAVASVGVAAHIAAASRGGPRYDESMTAEERSSIRNGIWLCATHATLVDRDIVRFPRELLLHWKAQHEEYVQTYLGASEGPTMQATIELGGKQVSDAAARILVERSPFWEHVLLAQLVRDEIKQAASSAKDLRYGVATGQLRRIRPSELMSELSASTQVFQSLLKAATVLLGRPVADALGAPGVEGDPEAIAYVARRLGDIYRSTIDHGLAWLHARCSWDEAEQVITLTSQFGSGIVTALEGFPDQIDAAMVFAMNYDGDEVITHRVTVTFDIEDGLTDRLTAELDRLSQVVANHGWPDED